MATIYPPIHPSGQLTREEALANTDPAYPLREEPLTPAQLDELRAKAPAADPNSHSARAAAWRAERAKRITITITEEQAARLKAVQNECGIPVSVQVRNALGLVDWRQFAFRVQKADENAR
jgi:hypothetical protein